MTSLPTPLNRKAAWKWWVSVLLLLATMINYMDRQTLANLSVRVTDQYHLSQEQYGDLELVFGLAFAVGSFVFGILADRMPVRLLYPGVLLAWSAIGFLTGLTHGYPQLIVCRTLLGFFEAGHWPCALVVTQAVMARGDRMLGNSVLQSGASLGAMLTPLIIRALLGESTGPDTWRSPFLVIGAGGVLWAGAWLMLIRPGDLAGPAAPPGSGESHRPFGWLIEFSRSRRFWALAFMVVALNISWHLIRAWLPRIMQQGRGYSEVETLWFNSAFYIATDVGCLVGGAVALWLTRRGTSVHRSRMIVFAVCAALAALTVVAAKLPRGGPLLGVLLVVGAATLALFPCYYSFTQELNVRQVGKATGTLAAIGWIVASPFQKLFGRLVDHTGSFDLGLAMAGCAPVLALVVMLALWRDEAGPSPASAI